MQKQRITRTTTCVNCETTSTIVVKNPNDHDTYKVEFCPFCGDLQDVDTDDPDEILRDEDDYDEE